jgi:flagellar hook-associated protein 1
VQQIQNQIGSVSGVSLDEEAANLALYQRSYQAMAQVASVVNDLMLAAINLGDSSTQS